MRTSETSKYLKQLLDSSSVKLSKMKSVQTQKNICGILSTSTPNDAAFSIFLRDSGGPQRSDTL
jgi:hypothetical protein